MLNRFGVTANKLITGRADSLFPQCVEVKILWVNWVSNVWILLRKCFVSCLFWFPVIQDLWNFSILRLVQCRIRSFTFPLFSSWNSSILLYFFLLLPLSFRLARFSIRLDWLKSSCRFPNFRFHLINQIWTELAIEAWLLSILLLPGWYKIRWLWRVPIQWRLAWLSYFLKSWDISLSLFLISQLGRRLIFSEMWEWVLILL